MTKNHTSEEIRTCMNKKVFPFMKVKWFFLLFSIICFGLSVYEIGKNGFNYGVDFLGGVKITYQVDPALKADDLRKALDGLAVGEAQIIPFGEENSHQFIVRTKTVENTDAAALVDKTLTEKFGSSKIKNLSSEVVGPKVGEDLRRKGLISLLFTCVLILIYTGFRFDFLFAPGAIIALIHDVVISAGFFAYSGKEFNLTILAALLTILGYSINDTIVIYDRIRENLQKLTKTRSLEDVIDISLTETFSRTIVTSLTVFIVVVALFLIGGGVLHDFSFCLIIGLIFGSYSSLFVASPVYLWLQKLFPTKGLQKVVNRDLDKSAASSRVVAA